MHTPLNKLNSLARRFRHLANELRWSVIDTLDRSPAGTPACAVGDAERVHYEQHGWVVLRKAVPEEDIARLRLAIELFRGRRDQGRDEFGHGVRIGLLHAVEPASLKVALNAHVRRFLAGAFGGDPVLFGSLTFDIGTEQEAHIDAAFFYTRPADTMAGCWTGLEDIHPDSGPLFVISGSHHWPRLSAEEVLNLHPDLKQRVVRHRQSGLSPDIALSNEVYGAYIAEVHARIRARGAVPTPALIGVGDVLIWHGWLIHGGLPRLDRTRTRCSMVAHFIKDSVPFWNQHAYFLHGDDLSAERQSHFTYRRSWRGKLIRYPDAVTFPGGDGHYKA